MRQSSSRIIGTGEMAEHIRNFDWENSLLGNVDTWSDELIITVNLMIASRHPMFLWWGPELIQFYNDAYRPSIREDKHPKAVGQRGRECWPEIWPIIGSQIDAVMSSGQASWNLNHLVPINRNGRLEEVFWTYGYSPVRNKNGEVQGTLVVCSETTEQVLSDRRLRTLLSISSKTKTEGDGVRFQPIHELAQNLVETLAFNPADMPFTALYLVQKDGISLAGTSHHQMFADPDLWPLKQVAKSRMPLLLKDIQARQGSIICPPWPEPVESAYILPLGSPQSSADIILVFGISPRLPFDKSYETFFHVVGTRIVSLLENEMHQQERALAAERFRHLLEEKVKERTSELELEVSERKRAEVSLGELTGQVLRMQDEERRHMARELHDSVGQALAALAMNITVLQEAAQSQNTRIAKVANDSRTLVDDLLKEIRTLSYLLHPPMLDEVGLNSALKWYAEGFSERSNIQVDLKLAEFGRLADHLELVIFRVVQESLTNIHRHSESSYAGIRISQNSGHVEVEIEDRGKGISPERQHELTTAKAGVGLRGMQERVRQLGGTLQIASGDQGTKITVLLPLRFAPTS